MAMMVDLDAVQKNCEVAVERAKKSVDDKGIMGVVCRLQVDTEMAMTLWRAKELNRNTNPNMVLEAIITAFTAAIVGELKQALSQQPLEVQFEAVNNVLMHFSKSLGQSMIEADEIANRIDAEEVGLA